MKTTKIKHVSFPPLPLSLRLLFLVLIALFTTTKENGRANALQLVSVPLLSSSLPGARIKSPSPRFGLTAFTSTVTCAPSNDLDSTTTRLSARRARRSSSGGSSNSSSQSDYVKARLGTAATAKRPKNNRRRRTGGGRDSGTRETAPGNYRDQISVGDDVFVVKKEHQRTVPLVETKGIVMRHLTNSAVHPRGIKVMLTCGQVGRVTRLVNDDNVDVADKNIELDDPARSMD